MLLENAMVNSAVASFGTTEQKLAKKLKYCLNVTLAKSQVNAVISLGIIWEF